MSDLAPLVYLVYGIPNSGRREVIFDLIEGGIPQSEQVLYFRPADEADSTHDEQIEALENVSVVEWSLKDSKVAHGKITAAPDKIIFLAPGLSDPADCAEAIKAWTDHNRCRIARIITVVHCHLLSVQEKAKSWFDACIHFSDVVLLNRREEAGNKWVKDFETAYKKMCNPARFIMVKKGRVTNPAEVLDPEARRVSLYFDELIPIEDDEFEDEHQPDDIKPDMYIERLESGQRAKPIPEIGKLLS
ncbi:GTP-binding protein [Coraliomargarita sp. SDUM461004]|uniref:GTP-binding protein n=1 Tax=Thalassobacterium sedimentorum TaxID=3041258 RepID=A0ABU1AEF4_9BACT|nr:GTP-binding protein [Coraliomargarita sp. SDUM461004]MDQ8193137.1 GTP-binding protein [Coraliomargarita sp. SDUM461004]